MFKKVMTKLAGVCSVCLSFALLVVANSNSSYLMYEEEAPEGLEAFSRIK